MQRRALLIGSPLGGLEGVSADLSAMTEALAAWNFQIQSMVEASASREGILAAYDRLIADTEPGDVAVLYYSGHGGYCDDPSAAAGRAEAFHQFIMPTDFYAVTPTSGEFRGIMSIELSHLQAQLTKKTDNVVSIFDCCHSARLCRGDLSRPRGLQASEWTATVEAFAKRLRAEGRVPDARLLAGNPNAVRLLACGQEQQAFEPRGGDPGFFTGELVAALRAALETPGLTWRQLMQRVRDRVLARVPSQYPELEGPGDRKLFETTTADLGGALPLGEHDRRKVLRGGAIMGVEVGDEYLVMKAGENEADEARAVARATVVEVESGRSSVTLEPMNGNLRVPPDAQAFPWRKHVRRGVVAVEGEGPLADALRRGIEASGRLRLRGVDEAATAMARVRVGSAGIEIFDAEGQRWIEPSAARATSIVDVVASLRIMAKADALRRLEGGRDREALDAEVAVEWGSVHDGQVTPLPKGDARVVEGDSVYVRVTNEKGSRHPVFASIFDIGLTGKITLVSGSGSTGMRIEPGEHAGIGLHPYEGIVGLGPLSWPDAAPRDMERRESLLVIVTREPHDFSGLEGAGATRGKGMRSGLEGMIDWIDRGGTRDLTRKVAATSYHFAVEHIEFLLTPEGMPT